jgi:ABC-type Mn2+/Zn2+ transport system ATPase subunit
MHLAPSLELDFDLRAVSTIEEQTVLFGTLSGITIPSLISGTFSFLREYGRWIHGNGNEVIMEGFPIFVPPNPSNALVFPTPVEDLRSALSVAAEKSLDVPDLESLLEIFLLDEKICHQPAYTLSGGERALFVLAKASVLLPAATRAVICNPSRWLHNSRRYLVRETLGRCQEDADPRILIHLEGEFDEDEAMGNGIPPWLTPIAHSIEWDLSVSGATVVFPSRQFPAETAQKKIRYSASPERLRLLSPTLLRGDNGVGKSTFAKLAAGLIPPVSGICRISVGNFEARARLLFQDTPEQLFGLSPDDHLKWISDYDKDRRKHAFQLSMDIQARIAAILKQADTDVSIGSDANTNTLVQARVILAAERLASGAKMLILDEPTWGLSRSLGLAFLSAIIEEANTRGVALLVISHEQHFPIEFFGSELSFGRNSGSTEIAITVMNR